MLGCTALATFSNSARVITVLQSDGVALLPAGFSQSPWTVTTGASAGTLDELSDVVALFAGAAGRGLRVGFAEEGDDDDGDDEVP